MRAVREGILVAVNPLGGGGEAARGDWCTPGWLADLIGEVDVDPCSNERSHIRARHAVSLPQDGCQASLCSTHDVVFVNPPYGRGEVIRWVRAHRHTKFVYLLRWDPSTEWFAELYPRCTHIWHPARRVNFEPPPGVRASSNASPHALYMRAPTADLLIRLAPHGYFALPDPLLSAGARCTRGHVPT